MGERVSGRRGAGGRGGEGGGKGLGPEGQDICPRQRERAPPAIPRCVLWDVAGATGQVGGRPEAARGREWGNLGLGVWGRGGGWEGR